MRDAAGSLRAEGWVGVCVCVPPAHPAVSAEWRAALPPFSRAKAVQQIQGEPRTAAALSPPIP